ncbi:MAG: hypothetical protein QY325_11240 [Flavobacteriales bacterium]|nr:MAG: hypothetical protein QY325_11240 [Flavobacteriales bacterium]
MAKRKRPARQELDAIERAAKREAQKAAGALDGRYRPRVVKSRKAYTRKPKHRGGESNGA